MPGKRSDDFRTWDLASETYYAGHDQRGLPFYLWRESADDRLYLGRPRYCCLTPKDGELYFTFFDPSKDQRPTGAVSVAIGVAALVIAVMMVLGYYDRQTATGNYITDTSTPPLMILVVTFSSATLASTICASIWYVAITLWRWVRDRFEGDGRFVMMPFALLGGFQMVNAHETGARDPKGEPTKSGYGLTAVFEDGTQIILTGNAWNYPSISDKHRDLTRIFRGQRDEILRLWRDHCEKLRRRDAPVPETWSANGVPTSL